MPAVILWIMLGLAFGTGVGAAVIGKDIAQDVKGKKAVSVPARNAADQSP